VVAAVRPRAQGVTSEQFIEGANASGRDGARTPVRWTSGEQAGFTDGVAWIDVDPNRAHVDVETDRADPDGVRQHYRRLVRLRRELPTVTRGRCTPFPGGPSDQCAAFALERARTTRREISRCRHAPRPGSPSRSPSRIAIRPPSTTVTGRPVRDNPSQGE